MGGRIFFMLYSLKFIPASHKTEDGPIHESTVMGIMFASSKTCNHCKKYTYIDR
jgi:hypothetical protein